MAPSDDQMPLAAAAAGLTMMVRVAVTVVPNWSVTTKMVLVEVVDVSSWIASTLAPLRKAGMPRFLSASGVAIVARRSVSGGFWSGDEDFDYQLIIGVKF